MDEAPIDVLETSEQAALERAGVWLRERMQTNKNYQRLTAALITFRRCYAVAYRELQEALAAEEAPDPNAEDVIVQSAMHAAAQPFSEHDLMRGFIESVLPWLAEVIGRHSEVDEVAAQQAAQDAEKSRRERSVPIGFRHHHLDCDH
ncbi:MAG: hypothetical protein L0312_24125, partial [Acidobacteria bacterium]|nr:hypothetical protein [Acidobacteriota bacterium]